MVNALPGIIAPKSRSVVQLIFVPEDITVKQDLESLCLAWVVPTTTNSNKRAVMMLASQSLTAGGQPGLL
jgi:hypothetical protein